MKKNCLGGNHYVLNLNPAKPSEAFFLTMNRMNGTGRGLVIYFYKDF